MPASIRYFTTVYAYPNVGFGFGSSNPVTIGDDIFVFCYASFSTTITLTDNFLDTINLIETDGQGHAWLFHTVANQSGAWVATIHSTGGIGDGVGTLSLCTSGVTSVITAHGNNAGFLAPGNISFSLHSSGVGSWTVKSLSAPAAATTPASVIGLNIGVPDFPVIYQGSDDAGNWATSNLPTINGNVLSGAQEFQTDGVHVAAFKGTGTFPAVLLASCNNPPNGNIGLSYTHSFTASGGTPPYTFTILSGSLPPGLSMNSSGNVTGIPTASGTFSFTIQVTDSLSITATADCSITVAGVCGSLPQPGTDVQFELKRVYATMTPHKRIPVRGS